MYLIALIRLNKKDNLFITFTFLPYCTPKMFYKFNKIRGIKLNYLNLIQKGLYVELRNPCY